MVQLACGLSSAALLLLGGEAWGRVACPGCVVSRVLMLSVMMALVQAQTRKIGWARAVRLSPTQRRTQSARGTGLANTAPVDLLHHYKMDDNVIVLAECANKPSVPLENAVCAAARMGGAAIGVSIGRAP